MGAQGQVGFGGDKQALSSQKRHQAIMGSSQEKRLFFRRGKNTNAGEKKGPEKRKEEVAKRAQQVQFLRKRVNTGIPCWERNSDICVRQQNYRTCCRLSHEKKQLKSDGPETEGLNTFFGNAKKEKWFWGRVEDRGKRRRRVPKGEGEVFVGKKVGRAKLVQGRADQSKNKKGGAGRRRSLGEKTRSRDYSSRKDPR